jgi:hypothetical protein
MYKALDSIPSTTKNPAALKVILSSRKEVHKIWGTQESPTKFTENTHFRALLPPRF